MAAETAVAAPAMLLLLLLIIQFAVWWHAVHVAQAGADQALAVARADGGTTAAGTAQATAVLSQLASGVLDDPQVTVIALTLDGQPQIRVDVTGTATSVVPGLTLPVTVTSQGMREAWTTPGDTP